ncbi:hypothetical protein SAMN05444680_12068 [Variovorax sp. YR216]|nr:hypothetical protein SAMN05444680_12068 [Variovorax sp. YR216]
MRAAHNQGEADRNFSWGRTTEQAQHAWRPPVHGVRAQAPSACVPLNTGRPTTPRLSTRAIRRPSEKYRHLFARRCDLPRDGTRSPLSSAVVSLGEGSSPPPRIAGRHVASRLGPSRGCVLPVPFVSSRSPCLLQCSNSPIPMRQAPATTPRMDAAPLTATPRTRADTFLSQGGPAEGYPARPSKLNPCCSTVRCPPVREERNHVPIHL